MIPMKLDLTAYISIALLFAPLSMLAVIAPPPELDAAAVRKALPRRA